MDQGKAYVCAFLHCYLQVIMKLKWKNTEWILQVQVRPSTYLSNTFYMSQSSQMVAQNFLEWWMMQNLLVIEDHGIILCLQAIILPLFSSKLILEVVCCQPKLKDIHRLLLFNILQRKKKHRIFVGILIIHRVLWWWFPWCLLCPPAVIVWSNGTDSPQIDKESIGNIGLCKYKNTLTA